MNDSFGLKKEERIYKRDELQILFNDAKSFSLFPFRVLHRPYSVAEEDTIYLKVAISIPKKRFKKAVDRNKLKRKGKEAFRLNRNPLKKQLIDSEQGVLLMLIYIAEEPFDYHKIEEKIILILQRLQVIYAKDN